MKTGLHPKYIDAAKVQCACGATFATGSTTAEIHTEVCSACHPFYTGKQKLLDTAGKVDKFRARQEAAAAAKTKAVKISDSLRAAAARTAVAKATNAVGSKKLVGKVRAAGLKAELEAAKATEAKAAKTAEAEAVTDTPAA